MFIGYARVSIVDQTLTLQCNALTAAGCTQIFSDNSISGSVVVPRGLDRALASLTEGDTLVLWKLDRLGRSLSYLVALIDDLGRRGVNFRSLSDPIDTASASGRLVFQMMSALAASERSLLVERTQAGIQAAKRRGVPLGRPNVLVQAQIEHARTLIEGGASPRSIAQSLRVGKSTLYRALKADSPPRGAAHG